MDHEAIVRTFVDGAVAQLKRQGLQRSPGGLPSDMIDSSVKPQDDWLGWQPVPSTVADDELDELERETGIQFPPSYRALLKYRHFIDLTELGCRFERHPSEGWHEVLRAAYFQSWPQERILGIGLLPIGSETFMDAGPVCFDSRSRGVDGDCPVVFWDHEWVETPREIRPLFSSGRKMFECLAFATKTDVRFVSHFEDDNLSELSEKKQLLRQFLDLDPTGAGGLARDYWTSWGVNPDSAE